MVHLIMSLCVGALAGYIAGKIMGSEGGLWHNIVLGTIGGIVGGLLLGLVGISSYSWVGDLVVAVLGACVFIFVGRRYFR